MKKKILIFSLLLAFILVSTCSSFVYAATHTLEQLADIFNNCNTVKQYKEYNYNLSAKAEGNKLTLELMSEYTRNKRRIHLKWKCIKCNNGL